MPPVHVQRKWRTLSAVLWVLLVLAGGIRPAVAAGFRIAPPSAWVTPIAPNLQAETPASEVGGGAYILLQDRQVFAKGTQTKRYVHIAYRIINNSGVQNGSQPRFSYDPVYQSLTIHAINIHRDGRIKNALIRDNIKTIQQESDLSAQIYNGRLSVLPLLEDVRVGDVVEYAYTTTGDNPALGDHFTDEIQLAASDPIHHLSYRLRWSSPQAPRFKAHGMKLAPTIHKHPQYKTYVWARHNVPPTTWEDQVPIWHQEIPWLQISENASWSAVSNWMHDLYKKAQDQKPAVQKIAKPWLTQHNTPKARLLAALRFVQREVRYLGIEAGRQSYEPHKPSEVLRRRFGDCKDKSNLLVQLLREVGIPAYPALVSTTFRRTLGHLLPSATVFDHVIVAVETPSGIAWMDPTNASTEGDFDLEAPPPFELALIIRPNENVLSPIPLPEAPSEITTKETFTIRDYHEPVHLKVRSRYRGSSANSVRSMVKNLSRNELDRYFLNKRAAADPKIKAVNPIKVIEDTDKNEFVIETTYEISEFFDGTSRNFWADKISDELSMPTVVQRKAPLSVAHPVVRRQSIEIHLPDANWDIPSESERIDGVAFEVNAKSWLNKNVLRMDYSYRSKVDHVSTADFNQYRTDIEHAGDQLAYAITYRATGGQSSLEQTATTVGFLLVIFFSVFIGIQLFGFFKERKARRRKRLFLKNAKHQAGESPATALPLREGQNIKTALNRRRCQSCGTSQISHLDQDQLMYGQKKLLIIRLACKKCQALGRLYFLPQ